jgi:hypothetical protein
MLPSASRMTVEVMAYQTVNLEAKRAPPATTASSSGSLPQYKTYTPNRVDEPTRISVVDFAPQRAMWTSITLSSGVALRVSCQTSLAKVSRLTIRPALRSNWISKSNSRGVRSTTLPAGSPVAQSSRPPNRKTANELSFLRLQNQLLLDVKELGA